MKESYSFLNEIHQKRPKLLTVEKKHLTLVVPVLGKLSLQTKTKLHAALK